MENLKMRKSKNATPQESTKEAVKPKAKRQTAASLRKEIESLKAANMKLLNEIGKISAMYMNGLSDKDRQSSKNDDSEREDVLCATKRLLEVLMHNYRFSKNDVLN